MKPLLIGWLILTSAWLLNCVRCVVRDVRDARRKEELRRRNIAARMRERLEAGKAETLKL